MRIEKYLNTSKEEVEGKAFNIWIGVSLGNKYFTKDHIRAYIDWALKHAKDRVLVVIGDALHASNLEVLDRRTPEAAMKKALRIGDAKYREIEEIISALPLDQRKKVGLVRWRDAMAAESFKKNSEIIHEAYKNNPHFREEVRSIVRVGREDRADRLAKLSEVEMDTLCEYILSEIPHFVDGVQCYGDGTVYTLLPYPGLSRLDDFFIGLQKGELFPEIAEKLSIKNKIAILEAYAD